MPVELDAAAIGAVAKWASASKVNADRAERWAVRVAEVICEWSRDQDDEDDDGRLDLLRQVEDISDYWDLEH